MTTDQTDLPSTVRRFIKLMQRATDGSSSAAERDAAKQAANDLFTSDADVRAYVEAKMHAEAASAPKSASRTAAPFAFDPSAALAQFRAFLATATPVAAETMAFVNVLKGVLPAKPSLARAGVSELLNAVDIAGRVFEDDDGEEIVIVTLTLDSDAASMLLTRADESTKVGRNLGDALLFALDATLADEQGAYGEWPLGDDES